MSPSHRVQLPSDATIAVPVAGEAVTGTQTSDVRSPFDDSVLGHVPVLSRAEVDRAVASAKAALRDNPLPPWQRADILEKASSLLRERKEQFAQLIAREAAKPIKTARVEAERAAGTFAFAAVEARTMVGEVVPIDAAPGGDTKVAYTMRVPIGVVGAISPFNFPLNLVAHKLAPAIAAGCPVVLKPAGQTPFSAIALAWMLIEECGLPPSYLSVVTGPGAVVGDALVEHPDIAMITFTGSPEVGWGIKGRAPRKHVGLELGNNAPVVVAADGDWKKAADKIKIAGFSHAGQSCISTQRIFVHESIADQFTRYLTSQVETLVTGDPLDENTDVSALITRAERDRVKSWVDEAVAQGGVIETGGALDHNGVLVPTVISNAKPEMKVCISEVFGPVVAIASIDSVDEGLKLANDTAYGLQAAVFTKDLATAFEAIRTLDFGGVMVNEVPTWRADQMPYGGIRDSGNTREGPAYSVREMTEMRLVVIDTSR